MSDEMVLYEQDGPLAVITLNRPSVLNALTNELMGALHEALHRAGSDGARAVLLTGAGRGFSAGADLGALREEYTADGGAPDLRSLLREHFHPAVRALRQLPMPVVAAVNGVAAGAGMALALACDIRLAPENARFATAFTRVGLVPDCGLGYTLPRIVGAGRASYLIMTGDQVDAATALQWGLVDRVFPAETFASEARSFAQGLANGPTRAFALSRQMIEQSNDIGFDELLDLEAEMQGEAGYTRDHRAAVDAFLNKAQATFHGE